MKGHIAFCPHFHQPHFQLYKTREEAYKNSYLPWIKLLKSAIELEGFYINLHFSGPFLYWMQDQKEQYIEDLNTVVNSNKAGIIGGLADEPFIQLSSRNDDYLYQLKKYDELMSGLTGITADKWQGIHIVERECGEVLLKELSYAAGLINTEPIFYLDAETFYNSHFSYPGSKSDYCLKHFGFVDPVSKTTISHIPQDMLYFALRDEIGGQTFYSIPVHSQYRYHLLKRQSFTNEDKVSTKPQHYYFYIKDALEKAYNMARRLGREIEPVLVIFEDAEKFGQWSKDPEGDSKWLLEFFRLVDKDEELEFTGLKEYLQKQGFFDTYPARSSHSYTEWENWTAKRGIRGVCFGDERLRRVINRLRDIEVLQDEFENRVINLFENKELGSVSEDLKGSVRRAMLQSAERYDIINTVLQKYFPAKIQKQYEIINRIRNLVYQEDPKWASRHPSYGSSPYYDMQGLAYLQLAEKMMEDLIVKIGGQILPKVQIKDWDFDGQEEIVVKSHEQMVVIDSEGGCISYHHVMAPDVAGDLDIIDEILQRDINKVSAYNCIFRFSYPLIFTETDSSLAYMFYNEGGRKEVCRNCLRCEIILENDTGQFKIGNFENSPFAIMDIKEENDEVLIKLGCEQTVDIGQGEPLVVEIIKSLHIKTGEVSCTFRASSNRELHNARLYLVPQIVTSAAASDEIDFKPKAYLGIGLGKEQKTEYLIKDLLVCEDERTHCIEKRFSFKIPEKLGYLYELKSTDGTTFSNVLEYLIDSPNQIEKIEVRPAVQHYYKSYVYEEQSRLGYQTSGILISPYVLFKNNLAQFKVGISWDLDTSQNFNSFDKVIDLFDYNNI